MNEKYENNNNQFNRLLSVGIVIGLILLGVGSIQLAKVLEKRMESEANGKTQGNPLINESEALVDDGMPDIPGVVVYHAENDIDEINVDAGNREKQFRNNLEKNKKVLNSDKAIELLEKKDDFAAKRLLFLKRIEAAESREERDKLIEELKKYCEENNKE